MQRLPFSVNRRQNQVLLRFRPSLTSLEDRTVPAAVLAAGADTGGGPHVVLRTDTNGDGTTDTVTASFMAYDPAFAGGVRVALGDFDGDGHQDLVTAAGPGGGPHVKVWKLDASGAVTGLLDSFFAFGPSFTGGVWLSVGNFNVDTRDELVVSADAGGGPHVKIYSDTNGDGRLSDNEVDSFFAFEPGFTGGVRTAVLGFRLVTAAGPGGSPRVKIFDHGDFDLQVSDEPVLSDFMAFDPGFTGGVYVAADRFGTNSTGAATLALSAGAGGGPHVKLYNAEIVENGPPVPPGESPVSLKLELRDSFFAYDPAFAGGVRAAFTDFNPSDPTIDLVAAPGPGGRSQVKIWREDPTTGQVSNQPPEDIFTAYETPAGDPLDIGVFVGYGSF